jgi:hypothetical protein
MTADHLDPSTDDVLTRGLSGAGDARTVTLDPRFQGLPDTAHGGTVLALFDAVTRADGARAARSVAGIYRRRVPLATPLQLTIDRDVDATRLRLSEDTTTLVEGAVTPFEDRHAATSAATLSALGRRTHETPLPLSSTCFACGTDNTLGLRAQLTIDDEVVGGVWNPPDRFRFGDTLAPVAVTTLLDEAAFWLGAAASGESGMTTDLRVQLHPRDAVRTGNGRWRRAPRAPKPDDARYWITEFARGTSQKLWWRVHRSRSCGPRQRAQAGDRPPRDEHA